MKGQASPGTQNLSYVSVIWDYSHCKSQYITLGENLNIVVSHIVIPESFELVSEEKNPPKTNETTKTLWHSVWVPSDMLSPS